MKNKKSIGLLYGCVENLSNQLILLRRCILQMMSIRLLAGNALIAMSGMFALPLPFIRIELFAGRSSFAGAISRRYCE